MKIHSTLESVETQEEEEEEAPCKYGSPFCQASSASRTV